MENTVLLSTELFDVQIALSSAKDFGSFDVLPLVVW